MIHDERECLIVLKTHANRTAELVGRIPGLHPYEVPEVLVLRVDEGHAPYVDWVASATVPGPEGAAE
jgi:periplasmic divalent cation tolerance protein